MFLCLFIVINADEKQIAAVMFQQVVVFLFLYLLIADSADLLFFSSIIIAGMFGT